MFLGVTIQRGRGPSVSHIFGTLPTPIQLVVLCISIIFYIIFYKFIFIFLGQLLVLLSLSVWLTLCCVTLTFVLFTIHFEQQMIDRLIDTVRPTVTKFGDNICGVASF